MALLPSVFVPEEAEDMQFTVIKSGWYPAELVKSTLKDTRNKDGKYLEFQFKIIEDANDEKSEGRFVFANLNIVNKNETAVKIAHSDLKAICEAVGFEGDLEDTVDLHNIPLMINVKLKPETPDWPAKNEIKGYKAYDAE